MSQQRRSSVMTLTVDYDQVTFQSAGSFPSVIKKPGNVGVQEWMEFWGGKESEARSYGHDKFTHEEALKNHKQYFNK